LNPKFEQLINALKEGDLDKIPKLVFSVIREAEESYEFPIPGKPLFVNVEPRDVEDGIIKDVLIELYYPGWVLYVGIVDKEGKIGYSYSIEKSTIEGVYIHE